MENANRNEKKQHKRNIAKILYAKYKKVGVLPLYGIHSSEKSTFIREKHEFMIFPFFSDFLSKC